MKRWSTVVVLAGLLLLLTSGFYQGWQWWSQRAYIAQVRAQVIAHENGTAPNRIPGLTPAPPSPLDALTPAVVDTPTPVPTPVLVVDTVAATRTVVPPTPPPTPTPQPPAPPIRLLIPALDIDTPVVPVTNRLVDMNGQFVQVWETADYAAGYHDNGVRPGERGNLIISGHNNIKGQVFRPLSALGEPDVPFPKGALVYVVDAVGRVFVYRFEEMVKLKEAGATLEQRIENGRWLANTSDPVLTLVTCWPLNSNTHRIVVRARLIGTADPSVLPKGAE